MDALKTVITGRFCEPNVKVEVYSRLPGSPKGAEGRFVVDHFHVLHGKKVGCDLMILFDDDAQAGERPLSNVALHMSFAQAKDLAERILSRLPMEMR